MRQDDGGERQICETLDADDGCKFAAMARITTYWTELLYCT